MNILATLREFWNNQRQRMAEREALQHLVRRRDRRLLRDAGLELVDATPPTCTPLRTEKERRWRAPLVRLSPVLPRRSNAKNVQPATAQEPCSAEAPSAA
jgi:uncharacterized protein YjiS (DUF1127 family)